VVKYRHNQSSGFVIDLLFSDSNSVCTALLKASTMAVSSTLWNNIKNGNPSSVSSCKHKTTNSYTLT